MVRGGHRAIVPKHMAQSYERLRFAPAVQSHGHLFLTGMTGSLPDGQMPHLPEDQFHAAFAKIAEILNEAGVDMSAIVEMTTYHVDLQKHFDAFDRVRKTYVQDPFPAWTAVEVAGLRRSRALVEIRVIARANQ